jgi:hypothetical protein
MIAVLPDKLKETSSVSLRRSRRYRSFTMDDRHGHVPVVFRPTCMISAGFKCHAWKVRAHACIAGVDWQVPLCQRDGVQFNCSEVKKAAWSWWGARPGAKGAWSIPSTYLYELDLELADGLAEFFLREHASVIEFGAGFGCYADQLRAAHVRSVVAFDGSPGVANNTGGLVGFADLTTELHFARADWVLNLAVAEHVPKQWETALLANLARHARRGIVISWGSGAGNGHVNRQRPPYVRAQMLRYWLLLYHSRGGNN